MFNDPSLQANPWAASAYGIPSPGIGFQTQGNIPFNMMSQPGTQFGGAGLSGFGQHFPTPGLPFGAGQQGIGQQPYGPFAGGFNPQHLASLLPQTWLGPQLGQHPLLHHYAQALMGGQQNPYGGGSIQGLNPWAQTGGLPPHLQTGLQLHQQLNPWAQTGFGPTTPFGQIHPLAQALLSNLYQQGLQGGYGQGLQGGYGQGQQGAGGQYGFGRSPFGYGGYPFM